MITFITRVVTYLIKVFLPQLSQLLKVFIFMIESSIHHPVHVILHNIRDIPRNVFTVKDNFVGHSGRD